MILLNRIKIKFTIFLPQLKSVSLIDPPPLAVEGAAHPMADRVNHALNNVATIKSASIVIQQLS